MSVTEPRSGIAARIHRGFALAVVVVMTIEAGLFGTNMRKPMLGDPSRLTDTMWGLIVDTIGAAVISI